MKPTSNADDLQKVADFSKLRQTIRDVSHGCFFFGFVNLLIGLMYLQKGGINAVLVVLAVLLLAEGAWLRWAPSAGGLLLDGFTMSTIALWNLSIAVLAARAGEIRYAAAGFGMLCLGVAVYRFATYSRTRALFREQISSEETKTLEDLVRYVINTDP
jgi:hypothetical protein